MKDSRLQQVYKTMAFMKSAILSGKTVTYEMKEEFAKAISNLNSIDKDLQEFLNMPV